MSVCCIPAPRLSREKCKYAPLCPFATEEFWKEKPKLRKSNGDHFVACHRVEELPAWELRGA
ncbi:hypothetical protein [Palaeococcus sp. (in: euryarchaeotes)]